MRIKPCGLFHSPFVTVFDPVVIVCAVELVGLCVNVVAFGASTPPVPIIEDWHPKKQKGDMLKKLRSLSSCPWSLAGISMYPVAHEMDSTDTVNKIILTPISLTQNITRSPLIVHTS